MSVELTFHPFLTRVGLHGDCVKTFEELKLGKKIKCIIYKLSSDNKSIEVEQTSTEADYEVFISKLPETECRYAVYDFEYELEAGEGTR